MDISIPTATQYNSPDDSYENAATNLPAVCCTGVAQQRVLRAPPPDISNGRDFRVLCPADLWALLEAFQKGEEGLWGREGQKALTQSGKRLLQGTAGAQVKREMISVF